MPVNVQPYLNDRVLVTFNSNVVRSVIYLGKGPSPLDPSRIGYYLGLTRTGEVIEWVDQNYIRKLEVTFRTEEAKSCVPNPH